ncbi:serine protease [Pseudoroseomonas cervicalis]|uniref:S1 family peptidase n=1 Tax=Teichococcus cervicalis TaxID=204525 RepID=UPI0035EEB797
MQRSNSTRRGVLALAMGGLLGACGTARQAADQAQGTPAERIARSGFAAVQLQGVARGSAIGFDGTHLLTCAHVLGGAEGLSLRRADGAEVSDTLVGRSARMDLAVLRAPEGFLDPARPALARLPQAGEAVWAAGAPGLGAAIASGHVEAPDAEMPGFGRGFTARMPALMGYSGGPVVDGQGSLLGLTAALPAPGAAGALAFLAGADLDGLLRRDRQVFVLSYHRAAAEAARLLGRTAA